MQRRPINRMWSNLDHAVTELDRLPADIDQMVDDKSAKTTRGSGRKWCRCVLARDAFLLLSIVRVCACIQGRLVLRPSSSGA